ncbi:MAG: exodeoxyribonuclease VII large subunit, partial [Elusimicrobiota bacterium]|nr:exodeoxyribonuclease VII large subunit [Elusimicrobiota bacterium]
FPVPVITGIGHHKDIPLMSLASDVSVSTPTAVSNIINKSWEENNFWDKRGLVDWKMLETYHEGLICLTGCFWNIVARRAEVSTEEAAEENFKKLYDIFGKDLYCELARHNVEAEEKANELMLKFAKKYSVKPVVTNDVHYLNKSDFHAHDCYIKSRFEKLSSFSYDGEGFELKTIRQMKALGFKEEYLDNTFEVAHMCSVDESSFKKGETNPMINSLEEALSAGRAAYIPSITTVAEERAKDICRKLNKGPEQYKKLVGLWRRPGVNTKRLAVSGSPRLNKITPVFMHQGKRVCQLSEKELSRQDIEVIDA